ncbi:hypothetical protein CUT44_14030 [Streptomyces carminius]|uniref:Uncharacterized protein n=1 Tax=Streptomyces carminius TaxID=2665496 RepID=A0A2M8LYV2_9ACTN|nr:hypothetical protein [Streptomyces carminius]PJE97099.1 hypothetical protein CUT44_14030 [Streptomyces carminius]
MSGHEDLPRVGDEVLENQVRAIVTDIRSGVIWLRAAGREEWPAEDPGKLRVRRTRTELIAAGEL